MSTLKNKFDELHRALQEDRTECNADNVKTAENIIDTLPVDLFDVDWNKFTIDGVSVVSLLEAALKNIYKREGTHDIVLTFENLYEEAGLEDVDAITNLIRPEEEPMARLVDKEGLNWRYYCTCLALDNVMGTETVDIEVQEDRVLTTFDDVENTIEIFNGNPFVSDLITALGLEVSDEIKLQTLTRMVEDEIFSYQIVSVEDDINPEETADEEIDNAERKSAAATELSARKNESDCKYGTSSRVKEPTREYVIEGKPSKCDALRLLLEDINSMLNKVR